MKREREHYDSIIEDRATGAYYCGKIRGVVQWRPDQSEALRMRHNRAWNVLCV